MEQVYFQEADVIVSNSRFVVGSQTFAMRNITSVNALRFDPSRGAPISVLIIGLLVAGTGFGGISMGFGVCGLAIIVLSVIWLLKQKPTYCVVLSTSGGEVRAIQTSDWPFIERIVTALNEAIMSHT